MTEQLVVALAQLDFVVGDIQGNTDRIIEYSRRAQDELGADLVVFPELALSGYPPEDLLFHSGLRRRLESSIGRIRGEYDDQPARERAQTVRPGFFLRRLNRHGRGASAGGPVITSVWGGV